MDLEHPKQVYPKKDKAAGPALQTWRLRTPTLTGARTSDKGAKAVCWGRQTPQHTALDQLDLHREDSELGFIPHSKYKNSPQNRQQT